MLFGWNCYFTRGESAPVKRPLANRPRRGKRTKVKAARKAARR